MLVELAVRNLGVIAEARIPLQPGLTAVTGETGAGKTMVVEALGLLCGSKPDPGRVRPGAAEAVVEGLFAGEDDGPDGHLEAEWVLRRVVPASGRSRSYVDGELTTAALLGDRGGRSIEVHGQHAQQALLQPRHQREALDRFAGIDTGPLRAARAAVTALEQRLDELGGDERVRAREIDLLRYQIDEIDAVDPRPGEEEDLALEEDVLSGAVAHREAAEAALDALGAEGGVLDGLATAAEALRDRAPFEAEVLRLDAVGPELRDVLAELRARAESIEPDDERLAEIRERRHRLVELRRKYGDDLDEVLAHAEQARHRLEELTSLDATRAGVEAELATARAAVEAEGRRVGDARRAAAPELAERLVEILADLALPGSRIEVAVTDREGSPGAGDDVELRLATNPGAPLGGLSKVASGGELSRVMLALRLILSGGPDVMVFDEVDAGIGGEAATAVGAALARLASDRQVLVVTHLPQVAAYADHQLRVAKRSDGSSTLTVVEALTDDDRVIELSRMMTGQPDSATARDHAEELLATSAQQRGR
jgi:DNA repair protein RecN (Recombination protein N)